MARIRPPARPMQDRDRRWRESERPVYAPLTPAVTILEWRFGICALLLMGLTLGAFARSFNYDFVTWDDPDYVINNMHLRDREGLKKMWNPQEDIQQYYPLVFTSLWIEYQLRDNVTPPRPPRAGGYHVTNTIMHMLNVLLALILVRKMGAPLWVATVTAGFFAVHPTQVAAVVWVSERKNVLAGIFYFTTFLLYLWHRRTDAWPPYFIALVTFILGLLSKTQTITLPVTLFLADWCLQRTRRIHAAPLWAVAMRVAPMLLIGAGMAMITSSVEWRNGPRTVLNPPEVRLLIAANTPWFYLYTFLAPFNLAPVYKLWTVSLNEWYWYPTFMGWAIVAGLVLVYWRRIPPLLLFAMAQFFILLAPVIGLAQYNYQQYALVADHFLYWSCMAGGLALALLAWSWIRRERSLAVVMDDFAEPALLRGRGKPAPAQAGRTASRGSETPAEQNDAAVPTPIAGPRWVLATVLAAFVLAGMAFMTDKESQHWRNVETFWKRAIAKDPDCFPANFNLANHYNRTNQPALAIPLYREACRIRPDGESAFQRLCNCIDRARGPHATIQECTERIKKNPRFWRAYIERGDRYRQIGKTEEAIADYMHVYQNAEPNSPNHREARSRLQQMGVVP